MSFPKSVKSDLKPPLAHNLLQGYNLPMPYIIDGHNLIGRMAGISLEDIDDERQLIELLVTFSGQAHKDVEVFFDNAPPGQMRVQRFGRVVARFVRAGLTADDAIRSRLTKLEREARNWTVVSSDRRVQASARAAGAQVQESATFARLIQETLGESRRNPSPSREENLSPDEVEDWLRLFQDGDSPEE